MIGFTCPECDERAPAGTLAGAVYACPACRNPVLPVARSERAAAPTSGGPGPKSRRASWKVGSAVFLALLAAYAGAYLLVTAEASRERASLLALHGPAIVEFPPAGDPPTEGGGEALGTYRAAHERFEARQAYERHTARIDAFFIGLLAAFVGQTVLTAGIVVRSVVARRAVGGRARRRATR